MAYNPFIGWSQADLESELELAQTDLAQGKTTTQAGDGNVMVKSQISARPEVRVEIILRALNRIAPTLYPIGDITRITTARVVFGDGSGSSTPQTVTAANAITYAGPPIVAPPYIAAIVVDSNGRQWMYWGNEWH
jgi:hypothetical protein